MNSPCIYSSLEQVPLAAVPTFLPPAAHPSVTAANAAASAAASAGIHVSVFPVLDLAMHCVRWLLPPPLLPPVDGDHVLVSKENSNCCGEGGCEGERVRAKRARKCVTLVTSAVAGRCGVVVVTTQTQPF